MRTLCSSCVISPPDGKRLGHEVVIFSLCPIRQTTKLPSFPGRFAYKRSSAITASLLSRRRFRVGFCLRLYVMHVGYNGWDITGTAAC